MNNISVIYGGRFQPPHPGHNMVYVTAQTCCPFNVRLCTSNKTGPNSPFNFEDKAFIWERMFGHTVEYSEQPVFNPSELVKPENPLILICGDKDVDRYKKSPHYLPIDGKQYIYNNLPASKDKKFFMSVDNYYADIFQGTYLRNNLKYNKELFIDVYGRFDQDVYDLINERLP